MCSRSTLDGALENNRTRKKGNNKTNKSLAMKRYAVLVTALLYVTIAANPQEYPDPEFSNEIYFLKKDSVYSLVRLEKESANMEMKTKAAGFGGYENGYILEGEKSSVRLTKGPGLSFIF